MRKLILAFPVLLLLGGCAGVAETALNLPSGVLTTSVQNPVSKNTLFRVENGLRIAVAGLQTYKNYCNGQPVGDRCDVVVVQLQTYSRRARPLVRQLRTFVRRNDQVNAAVVFTTLRGLFAEFSTYAAQNGVPVPQLGV
jgi:hypothetical protein